MSTTVAKVLKKGHSHIHDKPLAPTVGEVENGRTLIMKSARRAAGWCIGEHQFFNEVRRFVGTTNHYSIHTITALPERIYNVF